MEWEIWRIGVKEIGPSLRQEKSELSQPLLMKKTNPHNPPLYKGRFGWELLRVKGKNQKLN